VALKPPVLLPFLVEKGAVAGDSWLPRDSKTVAQAFS